ncbi:MAG: Hydantoinase B/oxoprolinase [Gemmatimonadetes bacterium]|nr:Hydantoinase B/oxoprolinase [Gemmatimonadota bacterium]
MTWHVGVDVGGTFTDLVAVDAKGRAVAYKVLSTPADQSVGVEQAIRLLNHPERSEGSAVAVAVARFVHGTTVATNTLLERNGARVVLCLTEHFTDLLELRRQDRASLYDLTVHHPAPLVPREMIVAVPERMTPSGALVSLSGAAAASVAEQVAALNPDIVAISLLHSYAHPAHETQLADAIHARLPDVDVVTSHEVFPEIREYERTSTTAAEAYLRPRVSTYLRNLAERVMELGLPAPGVMTSSGGMRTAADASRAAARLALSGPAGGIVGAAATARAAGIRNALTIDIGGTSADVGLILDGHPLVEPGGAIAGVPLALPRVLVETVSAGGGSIAWVDDGGALRAGPRSAGAVPGPAAFGRGGTEATVTDAHVVLGHISASRMSGGVQLDAAAAHAAIGRVAAQLGETPERTARAIIATADASMARALRRVSVERGVDPRSCVLLAFGGGGPLHACGLAEQLGMTQVFVPPFAGVLSALGLAVTAERREAMQSVGKSLGDMEDHALTALRASLHGMVDAPEEWTRESLVRARFVGQGHEIDVPLLEGDSLELLAARFLERHEARYAFVLGRDIEIVSARHAAFGEPITIDTSRDGSENDAEHATVLVADGWTARELQSGGMILERSAQSSAPQLPSTSNLSLAVMSNAFSMIAEEMGAVLTRGALSPNIRERKDASAALFDAKGRMVAQAAHIPVHLGAMPEAVAAVMARDPMPGDVFILNDPYHGGSHLPDLTLIEAIASYDGQAILGFAAVRAHHADVGGMSPGSMPQGATELVQEGLILPPVRLVRQGGLDQDMLSVVLANVRTPQERMGDLKAQLAACTAGANGWRALIAREGAERIEQGIHAVLTYTERRARACIRALGDISGAAEDALEGDGVSDGDVAVKCAVSVEDGDTLVVDLTGSAPQVPGNVNCPLAVARAAAVFVLRTLMDDDVPTNDGIARAIRLIAPERSAVNAQWPAAVAAGNVEMSQRITDTIFLALANAGVAVIAQGQGTMNNITFGGAGWTFYETLGGGQGASEKGDAPSAVHVGMSNTLNTPIESLERAYPMRVAEYSLRAGSGGAGAHRGGDGLTRRYEVLAPCTVTLLTERRRHAPQGAAGGAPGATGHNLLNDTELPPKCRRELKAGDVVTMQTPGGGGSGR